MHSEYTPEQIERFWSKVDRSGGPDACWPWIGYREPRYGRFHTANSKQLAHRVTWGLTNGPIPPDLCVCHRCDAGYCVNPSHLFLGTHAENMADRNSKGRQAAGLKHGSCTKPETRPRGATHSKAKLTDEQVAEIRRRYAAGGISQAALAREYGVSKPGIRSLVSGRTRK